MAKRIDKRRAPLVPVKKSTLFPHLWKTYHRRDALTCGHVVDFLPPAPAKARRCEFCLTNPGHGSGTNNST